MKGIIVEGLGWSLWQCDHCDGPPRTIAHFYRGRCLSCFGKIRASYPSRQVRQPLAAPAPKVSKPRRKSGEVTVNAGDAEEQEYQAFLQWQATELAKKEKKV